MTRPGYLDITLENCLETCVVLYTSTYSRILTAHSAHRMILLKGHLQLCFLVLVSNLPSPNLGLQCIQCAWWVQWSSTMNYCPCPVSPASVSLSVLQWSGYPGTQSPVLTMECSEICQTGEVRVACELRNDHNHQPSQGRVLDMDIGQWHNCYAECN